MVLRVIAVALGYIAYLLVRSQGIVGAVLVWAGVVLLGWAVIERLMIRNPNAGRLESGSMTIGGGLIAAGLAFALL
jgi:hypothetical protein